MATTRVAIVGLDKLRRKFRNLPIEQKKALRKAMEKNARELTDMQRHLVPVRTGALRRSIKWRWAVNEKSGNDLRIVVSAGSEKKSGSGVVFIARFVEFGTRPGKKGRRITLTREQAKKQKKRTRVQQRNHPGTKPQPFFFPAYRALRRRLRGRVSRAVTKAARNVGAIK